MRKSCVHVVRGDRSVELMFENEGWEVVDLAEVERQRGLLCFTGGEDINPKLYGEENEGSRGINDKRDEYEKDIWEFFNGLQPMIGICRGGQLLNVLNGGKMKQDHSPMHSGLRTIKGPWGSVREVLEDHHQVMIPPIGKKCYTLWSDMKDDTSEVVILPQMQVAFQAHPEWGHEPTREFFFHTIAEYI